MPSDHAKDSRPNPRVRFDMRSLLLAQAVAGLGLGLVFSGGFTVLLLAVLVAGYAVYLGRRDWALVIGVGLAVLSIAGFGSSTLIRVDTGDQLECLWGIPVHYQPMEPVAREALMSLNGGRVGSEWVWCTRQQNTTNHPGSMMYSYYANASAWVAVDHDLARLIVRDLAAYLRKTHATKELPECSYMASLGMVKRDPDTGIRTVQEHWDADPFAEIYLTEKGVCVPVVQ